jgi:type II secretory pathway component PulF
MDVASIMKRTQVLFASAVGLLAALGLAGVLYLAFIFPKTVALWADEGRALSGGEQTLANLGKICTSSGLILIPVLLLAIIGCAVWLVFATARERQESVNKDMNADR